MSCLRFPIVNICREDRHYKMFDQNPILEETMPNSLTKILELIYLNVYYAWQETPFEKQCPDFNEADTTQRTF